MNHVFSFCQGHRAFNCYHSNFYTYMNNSAENRSYDQLFCIFNFTYQVFFLSMMPKQSYDFFLLIEPGKLILITLESGHDNYA